MPPSRARHAMNLSFGVSWLILAGKVAAWWLTGSAAILADAAESVVHLGAVGFAALSVRLAARPASQRLPYGYERISFFSAGFEGGLIFFAGVGILLSAVDDWRTGIPLRELGTGTAIILAAALCNLGLGWYLVRVGRREHNIILEANGKHLLSDSGTSFGVVAGLTLVLVTGWKPFDPICAILVATQLLRSGGRLVERSVKGLLDYADPQVYARLNQLLDEVCAAHGVQFHQLRFRSTGQRLLAVAHLLFPSSMPIGEAHRLATEIEDQLQERFDLPVELETHLESREDHAVRHANRNESGEAVPESPKPHELL